MAFSPDGKWLATIAAGDTVTVWDIRSMQSGAGNPLLRSVHGHIDGILSIAFSPDSKLLASGGYDFVVRVRDVTTGRVVPHDVGKECGGMGLFAGSVNRR